MKVLTLILEGGKVLLSLGPIALEVAMALKVLFGKIGANYTVEIHEMQQQAVADADATLDLIATWKKDHGYV